MSSPVTASEWPAKEQALVRALEAWWEDRTMEWDLDAEDERPEENGLWHHMPEIDSKEVVRAMHLFEEHLGIELDLEMIRPGGYDAVGDMAEHLMPQLRKKAQKAAME